MVQSKSILAQTNIKVIKLSVPVSRLLLICSVLYVLYLCHSIRKDMYAGKYSNHVLGPRNKVLGTDIDIKTLRSQNAQYFIYIDKYFCMYVLLLAFGL